MLSEPYKIKEVKKSPSLKPYERWNIIKHAGFNTYQVAADHVAFDMVAKGMSAWSQFQRAALMIGDEAYAGARSYHALQTALKDVLDIQSMVPTHNGIGSEKLVATTQAKKGQVVLHNRGRSQGLIEAVGATSVDVSSAKAFLTEANEFGADLDLGRLEDALKKHEKNVAYVHIDLCPPAFGCPPISLSNLGSTIELAKGHGIRVAIDISNILGVSYWISHFETKTKDLLETARKIINMADIVLMDAAEDARSDIGGFVAAKDPAVFEELMNQVVVFEGLHTYGGMTGRAMEVLAVGIRDMAKPELCLWHQTQIGELYDMLHAEHIPAKRSVAGINLDVSAFLPHVSQREHPKFALAASLYIQGGIRAPIDGAWAWHAEGPGKNFLALDVPRCAYTFNHLREISDVVTSVYAAREDISGLKLVLETEFVDSASFEPGHERLFVSLPRAERSEKRLFEPHKIAIFEPLKLTDKAYRAEAIKKAGYNTFLLNSEDVYVDFLTDSGTSAMSCHQWEGMTNTSDTPYANRHTEELRQTFRDILGFDYIIPTHQGRAAEHIMSQCMIKPGQLVPGNMYFTTTKLHQEMAGGTFIDVIVKEAHQPENEFPWKGNIDLEKLESEIARVGKEKIAYISHECCVNMAGGQPFSMQNLKGLSRMCQKNDIPIMFDATRCVENAWMIKMKDPDYAHTPVRDILREMMSYGDGATVSCKKDFLVNMGGLLACNNKRLADKFEKMLRVFEGEVTNGGMDTKDIVALTRGFRDSLDDEYIKMRIEQTQEFGKKLLSMGVPIVVPPGSHAIFLDAKRFLPHIDQEEYPAQALAAAIYVETGVRTMERGNVSKGRDPKTGQNYRPDLELVRFTIPRRVYTASHINFVAEGVKRLYDKRDQLSGLKFVYEPKLLRFFQGRFEPIKEWNL